jgi:hypothetical protein
MGARQLIINANHKTGLADHRRCGAESAPGLISPRRSTPQVLADVVEANNNGDWAATEGAGRARSRPAIAMIITAAASDVDEGGDWYRVG